MSEDSENKKQEHEELKKKIETLQQRILTLQKTDSYHYYKELFKEMPTPYHSLDEFGRILRVNHEWLRIMEYTEDEVLGAYIGNFCTKQTHAILQTKFPAYKKQGSIKGVEFQLLSKSGKTITFEVNGRIQYNDKGSMLATHCMLTDVSKRKQEIQEIQEAKNNWHQIFQAISSPAFILNEHYIIEDVNSAALKASKMEYFQIIGKHCYSIFHGKDATCQPEECPTKKLLQNRHHAESAEMEIEAFNGFYLVSCTPILKADGSIDKIIHIATDITERKKFYEALEESETKFREMTNMLPQTVYETDLQGNLTFVNTYGFKMFGYTEEDFSQGLNVFQMLKPEIREEAKEHFKNAIQIGENKGKEYIGLRKDGSFFSIMIYSSAFYKNNIPQGLRGILVDITEQKETEERIVENQRILSSLVSNLPGFVYRCKYDKDWTMLYMSKQCEAITGYSFEEFENNTKLTFNDIITQEYTEYLWNRWVAVIEAHDVFKEEYKIVDKHGKEKWVQEFGNAVYSESGDVLFIEGYIEDITERKLSELALKHSLLALSEPLDNVSSIEFTDLFSIDDIQKIQDEFAFATGVASIITKPDGTPITQPSNFCKLCNVITNSSETAHKACITSQASFYNINNDGPVIKPCLCAGLIDAGANIVVGGKHVANWLIGQVRTETIDEQKVLAYAKEIGVDEDVYLQAYHATPQISQAQFEKIANSLFTFAKELSLKAYQNIQQARFISQIRKNEIDLKEKTEEIQAQNEEYLQLNEELIEANHRLIEATAQITLSEQKYRTIIENQHDLVVKVDANGKFQYASPNYCQLFGKTEEQLIGKSFIPFVHQDDVIPTEQAMKQLFAPPHTCYLEQRALTKEGWKWLAWSDTAILNEHGTVKEIIGVGRDITQQKEAQERIRVSEEKFAKVFHTTPLVITITINASDVFLDVNEQFEKVSGYRREEALGKTIKDIGFVCDKERFKKLQKIIEEKQATKDYEISFRMKSGEIRDFNYSAEMIYINNEACLLSILEDITEKKKADKIFLDLHNTYHDLIETSQDLIWQCNTQGEYVFVNSACEDILGYTTQEMLGKHFSFFQSQQIAEKDKKIFERILQGEIIKNHESIHIHKDGSVKHIVFNAKQAIDNNGTIIGTRGTAYDITKRILAENALKLSETKYKSVVTNSDVVTFIINKQGIFEMSEGKCLQKIGLEPGQAVGLSAFEMYRDYPEIEIAIRSALKGNHVREEMQILDVVFDILYTPIQNESGEITHVIGLANDITDRKNIERTIQASEEKYRSLITQMEQGIAVHEVIYDEQGNVVDYIFIEINDAYERVTGLTRKKILNKRVLEILPNLEKYWIQTFGKVAVTGEPTRYENYSEELKKYFEVVVFRPKQHQFAVIVSDITERKNVELILKEKNELIEAQNEEYLQLNEELLEANQELYHAKQRAEESDHLKSVFLANLSHEIRTPMNAILGFSDLLHDDDITLETKKYYVSIIQNSGNHLLSIINDLIDVSKIETGQVVPYFKQFYVKPFLQDIYSTLKVTNTKPEVSFTMNIESIDDNASFISDEIKLRQIISNLIINALKFTDEGIVHLECSINSSDELCISVQDTGIGIAKEDYVIIFDRFRQVEHNNAIQKGGSGLGLAISKAYVDMMGGSISVTSELGKGSTFYVSIPSASNMQYDTTKTKESTERKELLGNFQTILVAEDDDINFFYLTKLFSKTNYKILRACNGLEAVDMFQKNPDIKIILMDIKMPIMNGYEATNKIRKINNSIPIIAQTAYALSEDETKIMSNGFNDYITKPIKRENLLELLFIHLQQ